MITVLELVAQFLWEGLVTYASSAEGKVALDNILNAVEAAGIDVPFYTPTNGQDGSSGGQGDVGSNSTNDQSVPNTPRRIFRQIAE